MPVTVTFKDGLRRKFRNAENVTLKGGVVVLTRSDGSEVATLHAEGILAINGQPISEVPRRELGR